VEVGRRKGRLPAGWSVLAPKVKASNRAALTPASNMSGFSLAVMEDESWIIGWLKYRGKTGNCLMVAMSAGSEEVEAITLRL
jgi:hypothetical protein